MDEFEQRVEAIALGIFLLSFGITELSELYTSWGNTLVSYSAVFAGLLWFMKGTKVKYGTNREGSQE